jgi:hypothetical protein
MSAYRRHRGKAEVTRTSSNWRNHDHDLLRIVIVSFDVSVSVELPIWGFLMRALLGILLTVWLNLLVSHPTLAEKRVGRPEAKQAIVRRSQEPTSPATAARPPLPAGEREKGCNATAVIVTGRPCD